MNYYIDKMLIKGFKSIKSCEIDLGRINILIGGNGSGKSNFISSFELLQHVVDGNLQSYVTKKGGPDVIAYCGTKFTEEIDLEYYFGDNGYQLKLSPTNDNQFMIEEENYYSNLKGNYNIGGGYLESRWKKGTGYEIDKYVQPILSEQRWKIYHFHDTSDSAHLKQLQGINDNMYLAPDARNIAAFLYMLQNVYPENYNRIVEVIRMAAPFFDSFILRPNPEQKQMIRLEWKDISSDKPFIASQISDGTLRFICLATLFLQPEEYMPDVILLDEPELGLHPFAILLLGELIKKASINHQLIVSTQSVELLNMFSPEEVIVVDHKENASQLKRLNTPELKNWLSDYSMGDLWKMNILGGRP